MTTTAIATVSKVELAAASGDALVAGVVAWGSVRNDIARALTAATPATFPDNRDGRPDDAAIRLVLRQWAFNSKQSGDAPADIINVLAWISRNTAAPHGVTGRYWPMR